MALRRRGSNDRQIAQARQRHIQRARNRRGSHGQHIDIGTQLFHLLLVAHPEAVFLVDNHQPQLLEMHIVLQQFVRADHDVDLAGGECLQCLAGFLAGLEA